MKQLILLSLSIFLLINCYAQVGITDDDQTISVDSSAVLELRSDSRGFLPSRLTNKQRDEITTPSPGLIIYNSEENIFQMYDGTAWRSMSWGIHIPSPPADITGDTTPICEEAGVGYSISAVTGATSYHWTVPSGSVISSGQGTTNITVDFGTESGNISVRTENTGGNSSYTSLLVDVGLLPVPTSINGTTCVGLNSNGIAYSTAAVPDATYYHWTVPQGATVSSGQGTTNITVDFSSHSGNVSVRAENNCSVSTYKNQAVSVGIPEVPGAITGTTTPDCMQTGAVYSIDSCAGALSYNWTVPSEATITSGQGTTEITVDFGTVSGNISVQALNNCGGTSYTDLAVTLGVPNPPDTIYGNTEPLVNETGVSYSVDPIPSTNFYRWTVPTEATIVSGQGTTEITVDFGTASGNVSVRVENTCGNSAYTDLTISLSTCPDSILDVRDGQYYDVVRIGNQCWFSENLNIGDTIWGNVDAQDNGIIEKYCYNNDMYNCYTYGGLYQWNEMMQYTTQESTQGICPPGWHIPSDEEWKVLEGTVDTQYPVSDPEWDNTGYRGYDAGKRLKSTSGWNENTGTDMFGFTALPGGYRLGGGNFSNLAEYATFWSSTVYGGLYSWRRRLYYNFDKVTRFDDTKDYGYSVRCLKD